MHRNDNVRRNERREGDQFTSNVRTQTNAQGTESVQSRVEAERKENRTESIE